MEVEFADEEQQEYITLDDAAHDFYTNFKANKGKEANITFSSHRSSCRSESLPPEDVFH